MSHVLFVIFIVQRTKLPKLRSAVPESAEIVLMRQKCYSDKYVVVLFFFVLFNFRQHLNNNVIYSKLFKNQERDIAPIIDSRCRPCERTTEHSVRAQLLISSQLFFILFRIRSKLSIVLQTMYLSLDCSSWLSFSCWFIRPICSPNVDSWSPLFDLI